MKDQAVKIILCYSHKDRDMVADLKAHLSPLVYNKLISLWDRNIITPGADWEQEIDKHLDEAQIILFLISSWFLASDYCNSLEVQQAIERHERKEARVIPVILRPSMWYVAPLHKLQPLPDDGKAISTWKIRDLGYKNVADGIIKVIEEKKVLGSHDERKAFKTNFDQLVVSVISQMRPLNRARSLTHSLQQLRMFIPNDVSLADLVLGWQILSHAIKQDEGLIISQRRATCAKLAQIASQITIGQGNLSQAIKTWSIWTEAFKKGVSDLRHAAMTNTFARELAELKEVAANP